MIQLTRFFDYRSLTSYDRQNHRNKDYYSASPDRVRIKIDVYYMTGKIDDTYFLDMYTEVLELL